jgi:hypothetical protein
MNWEIFGSQMEEFLLVYIFLKRAEETEEVIENCNNLIKYAA